MSARRPFPTGLSLVDQLRSCMLQSVPHNSTAGAVSSLPYDAAELIHDLYDALEEIAKGEGEFNRDPLIHAENTIDNMKELARAALAKARGETL